MKYSTLIAMVASVSAVQLPTWYPGTTPEELQPSASQPIGKPDPEDAWLSIPKFTDSTKDKMPWGVDEGGVPVERVRHADWLDKHVEEVRHIRSLVPPMPEKEDRVAVAD